MGELAFGGAGRIDPSAFAGAKVLYSGTAGAVGPKSTQYIYLSDNLKNYDVIIVSAKFAVSNPSTGIAYIQTSSGYFVQGYSGESGFSIMARQTGNQYSGVVTYRSTYNGQGVGLSTATLSGNSLQLYNGSESNTLASGTIVTVYGLKF